MMLATLIKTHLNDFVATYGKYMTCDIRRCIDSILACRTTLAGQSHWQCEHCNTVEHYPLSCGHRSCPICQQRDASLWLERQQQKLLPVNYYMITFTLPAQLRSCARQHQRKIYAAMFKIANELLKDFAKTSPRLGGDVGMLAVLHTHTRQLDYHPHLHIVVTGGGYNKQRKQWCKNKGKYLFNEFALAKVWRARMLEFLNKEQLKLPEKLPEKWVVDCRNVGQGLPTLKYLSRYLYRGVLPDKNIVAVKDGKVTFSYYAGRNQKNAGQRVSCIAN